MKRFAVIGLGNFGFHATKALFEDGNEVVAITKSSSSGIITGGIEVVSAI